MFHWSMQEIRPRYTNEAQENAIQLIPVVNLPFLD